MLHDWVNKPITQLEYDSATVYVLHSVLEITNINDNTAAKNL